MARERQDPQALVYRNFRRGVVDTVGADQIPDDAVVQAKNLVLDRAGNLRTRPGVARLDRHRNLIQDRHSDFANWTGEVGVNLVADVEDGPLDTSGDAAQVDNIGSLGPCISHVWTETYLLPTSGSVDDLFTASIYVKMQNSEALHNSTHRTVPAVGMLMRDAISASEPDRLVHMAVVPVDAGDLAVLGLTDTDMVLSAPLVGSGASGSGETYEFPQAFSFKRVNSEWWRVQITMKRNNLAYTQIRLIVSPGKAQWNGTNASDGVGPTLTLPYRFHDSAFVDGQWQITPDADCGDYENNEFVGGISWLRPIIWGASIRRGGVDPHPLLVHDENAHTYFNYPTSRITSIHQHTDADEDRALYMTSGDAIWQFSESLQRFERFPHFSISDALSDWANYDGVAILANPGHPRLVAIDEASAGSPAQSSHHLSFNGSTSLGDAGNSLDLNSAQSLTVRLRFRTTQATSGGLITKKESTAAAAPGWAIRAVGDGRIQFQLNDSSMNGAHAITVAPGSGGPDYRDGQWHELWARIDRSDQLITLWIDGVKAPIEQSTASVGSPSTSFDLFLGAYGNGSQDFDGDLDEIAVWYAGASLSVEEIEARMGKTLEPGDATNYWPAEAGSGATLADQEGSVDFALTAVTWVDTPEGRPVDIETTTEYAEFDGTNTVSTAGNVFDLGGAGAEITVRVRARHEGAPGAFRALLSKVFNNGVAQAGYSVRITNSDLYVASISDGANQVQVFGSSPAHDRFDEVWLRVDRTNQRMSLIVNGAVFASDITAVGSPSNAQNFRLGSFGDLSGKWLGDFLDAAVWASALTDAQIAERIGEDLDPADPDSLWVFDQGAGTLVVDDAGSNNMTLTSATWGSDVVGSPAVTQPSITVWNNRVWAVVDNTVQCSALGDHTDWESTGSTAGAATFEIGGAEDSPVTAIYPHQGKLWCFKRDRIYYIDPGQNPVNLLEMSVRSWSKGVGCVAAQSIQTVMNDLVFLSPYGVTTLSASQGDVDVSELDLLTTGVRAFEDVKVEDQDAVSIVLADESWYVLSFATGGSATPNQTWILDFSGAGQQQPTGWVQATGKLVASSFGRRIDSFKRVDPLIGGFPQTADSNNAYVYRWDHHSPVYDDDGDSYQTVLETKCFDGGDPFTRKSWHRWTMRLTLLTDDLTVVSSYFLDLNKGLAGNRTWNFSGATSEGFMYGSAIFGTSTFAIGLSPARRMRQRVQGGAVTRTGRHIGFVFIVDGDDALVFKELLLQATPITDRRE